MKTNFRPYYYYTGNLHHIVKSDSITKEQFTQIHIGIEHFIKQYEEGKKQTDSISVAYAFQQEVQKIIEKDENKNSEYGKQIKCGKGCSFCCNYHVDISDDEANLLVEYTKEEGIVIDKNRLEKQKDKNLKTWEELKYADRQCVFLDDLGACKVYKYRPISCRALQVVTPPSFCDAQAGTKEVASFSILELDVIASAVSNATTQGSMAKLLFERLENTTCDLCGEKFSGEKHKVYDENYNEQKGLIQCGCGINK